MRIIRRLGDKDSFPGAFDEVVLAHICHYLGAGQDLGVEFGFDLP